jgi:hypothetical protein
MSKTPPSMPPVKFGRACRWKIATKARVSAAPPSELCPARLPYRRPPAGSLPTDEPPAIRRSLPSSSALPQTVPWLPPAGRCRSRPTGAIAATRPWPTGVVTTSRSTSSPLVSVGNDDALCVWGKSSTVFFLCAAVILPLLPYASICCHGFLLLPLIVALCWCKLLLVAVCFSPMYVHVIDWYLHGRILLCSNMHLKCFWWTVV